MKHSFFPSAIKLWNSLPDVVVSQPYIDDFKENLKPVKYPQKTTTYEPIRMVRIDRDCIVIFLGLFSLELSIPHFETPRTSHLTAIVEVV